MKSRPERFLSEEHIDHNSEIFDYIRELHEYLWKFVRIANPSASGDLTDFIDPAVDAMQSRITELEGKLQAANEDAARLADELKIVLLKTGVVWEEAGEDSPALIIHRARIQQDGEG